MPRSLKAKRGPKGIHGRITEATFSAPSILGEGFITDPDGWDSFERTITKKALSRVTYSPWRSCPHCRLAGYFALFHKGNPLREHIRDHILAKRLDLPPPIPDRAKPLKTKEQ